MATLHRWVDKETMQKSTIDFALTIPAIWSDAARKKTQDSAVRAGMAKSLLPQIYSEPECAAIYALKDMDDVESLRINDCILICDAGGGTVDIITYKILQINPLSIFERTAGIGDYCRSTFIDPGFEKLFIRRMVNLPTIGDIEEAGVQSGHFHLTRAGIRGLFNPVIDRVLDLIKVQVSSVTSVNLVVLVGGCGESEYLYQRVRMWASRAQIRVLHLHEAATAIVRGAALEGLETTGMSKTNVVRRARRWYGVTVHETFVDGKHLPEDHFSNGDSRRMLATNQVRWFIRKVAWGAWLPQRPSQTYQMEKYPCLLHLSVPPTRLEAPVTKLCTITSDLTHLKKKAFASHWRIFQRYHTANYMLCLAVHNNNLTFKLEFEGRQYGVANIDFD
ncbi:MAG: hypothetical protein Q9204_005479 [Flavoplaca sp. TL-2023a]